MKKLLLIAALLLSGCSVTLKTDIDWCIKACEPNEGLVYIKSFGNIVAFTSCKCSNGATFWMSTDK